MSTRLSILPALLALLAAAPGCVDNAASVLPVGICSPATDAKVCASTGKCESFVAGQGFYYLFADYGAGPVVNPGLSYFMQFDNQLPDNADLPTGKLNTNDAYIDGVGLSFVVHPSVATPAFALPDVVASTFPTLIPVASNGTPAVTLIPFEYIVGMTTLVAPGDAVLVDVALRGRGKLADQSRFETASLTFPVWVINDLFPGYTCDTAGAVVTDFCPAAGQAGATFACSGSSSSTGSFTIGGTVTGLTGSGLILGTTGLSDLPVAAGSTTFQFGASVADGASYSVTVIAQPAGQTCVVTSGTGTVSGANVTSVRVTCA